MSCKTPAQTVRSSISITGTSQYIYNISDFTSMDKDRWSKTFNRLPNQSHLHLQIPRERFYVTDRQWSSIRDRDRSRSVGYRPSSRSGSIKNIPKNCNQRKTKTETTIKCMLNKTFNYLPDRFLSCGSSMRLLSRRIISIINVSAIGS